MTPVEDLPFPDRVAELRRLRGLTQRELGAALRRSESWVSQVERGVQPVERFAVLQSLADALGVPVGRLRPDANALTQSQPAPPRTTQLEALRLALTGHPALPALFSSAAEPAPAPATFRARVDEAWTLTHTSRFDELAELLAPLLPELESAVRRAKAPARRMLNELLAVAYQATAAAFAQVDDPEAAWVAADRSLRAAEDSGRPLLVIAGLFRMAHAFLRLDHLDLAEHVAESAAKILRDLVRSPDATPEELSLAGAMELVRAVIAARDNDRAKVRRHIEEARQIADRIGADRNDFNTEFGPTNVGIHAVSVAADLGDAGEALEAAAGLDVSALSPERQAHFHLDLARAHAQRRHVGEATAELLAAEVLSPEQIHAHALVRETIYDLLALSGRRPPEDLLALARRCGAVP
ncbi:MAG: helix-turn-helix domain-containing protein [Actinomycetota bacterium]